MQYIQIAESVLSKLPSNLQLPETRMTQEVKENRTSIVNVDNETNEDEDGNVAIKNTDEIDEDLV